MRQSIRQTWVATTKKERKTGAKGGKRGGRQPFREGYFWKGGKKGGRGTLFGQRKRKKGRDLGGGSNFFKGKITNADLLGENFRPEPQHKKREKSRKKLKEASEKS